MKNTIYKFVCYIFLIFGVLSTVNCTKKAPLPKELSFFKPTYKECRNEFCKSVAIAQERLKRSFQTGFIRLQNTKDKDLTTDWCYISPTKETTNLLIITSGIHGIEGYLGSAMQTLFLREILPNINLSKTGILLVHAVNPFGFKYYRRVNENNIDLNRNFNLNPQFFKYKNKSYPSINAFLNPEGEANSTFISDKIVFPLSVIPYLIKYGSIAFRTAILTGQYEFQNGIQYGGKAFTEEKNNIDRIFFKSIPLSSYKKLYLIDIHTGYGIKGKLQVFTPNITSERNRTAVAYVFQNYKIDWKGDDIGVNNLTMGMFEQYINDKLQITPAYSNIVCIPICLEFGTNNNQNLIPGIQSLRTLILENQGCHYGYSSKKSKARVKKQMFDLFYPDDVAWRTAAINQFKKLLPETIQNFIQCPLSEDYHNSAF